jgi:pimeloyl-ACP methyl ester carboxylesterase
MILSLTLPVAAGIALGLFTRHTANAIEAANPPVGTFVDAGGFDMHVVHVPRPANADLPALVFVHGASGNLLDQMVPFRKQFEGRAEMLFIDRPGHGWSERGGSGNDTPGGQARALAAVMKAVGIERAIIVGHSFGGAIAASFAVDHPAMTAGLVFLAPATHPWPGGVAWYYHVTAAPVVGWVFANTLATPAGLSLIDTAVTAVFAPNPAPATYRADTAADLVLRPRAFRSNATDVARLKEYVTRVAPRYREIAVPTVVITGDSDDIVLAEIHSAGLARDIAGAELVTVEGLGHKPDFAATELAVAAIEKVAGLPRDLATMAREMRDAPSASAPPAETVARD